MFTVICDDCGRTFLTDRLQLQDEVFCQECSSLRTEAEVERQAAVDAGRRPCVKCGSEPFALTNAGAPGKPLVWLCRECMWEELKEWNARRRGLEHRIE